MTDVGHWAGLNRTGIGVIRPRRLTTLPVHILAISSRYGLFSWSAGDLDARRTDEATEFLLKKPGEVDRRQVLKIRSNDLHTNRQTF